MTLRRSMFNHKQRLSEETSVQKSLEFVVIRSNNYCAQRGHHYTILLDKLQADLQNEGMGILRSCKRLRELWTCAKEKNESITEASPSDCFVSYTGHSLEKSYPSAVMQSICSAVLANWAMIAIGVMFKCLFMGADHFVAEYDWRFICWLQHFN